MTKKEKITEEETGTPLNPDLFKSENITEVTISNGKLHCVIDFNLDRETFCPSFQDKHGHSSEVKGARFAPSTMHQISTIIQAKVLPCETPSDFLRCGVNLLLSIIHGLDAKLVPDFDRLRSTQEALSRQRVQHEYMETLEEHVTEIRSLKDEGYADEARELAVNTYKRVSGFDDRRWRDRYTKKLRERFPEYQTDFDIV